MLNSIVSKILLKKISSSGAYARSEKAAVSAFQRAAAQSHWYRAILNAEGVDISAIKTFEQFKANVPILNKQRVFGSHTPAALMDGKLNDILLLSLSSGTTGIPSFGIQTYGEIEKAIQNTDFFLKLLIGVNPRNTLIINCSGMGVRVFTRYPVCEPGCREDLVAKVLNAVGSQYENIVIATSPCFLKRLVEYSIEKGVDFNQLNTFFITGGEYFPESMRSYIHNICGKSFKHSKRGYWLSIYGLTELGYPIMFESVESALLRGQYFDKYALENQSTTNAPYILAQPYFFHYLPFQNFIETIQTLHGTELVFTNVSRRSVPMIRYNTGDLGELLKNDYSTKPYFNTVNKSAPLSICPIVKFWGRAGGQSSVAENDILELLFREQDIAAATTGFFTLKQRSGSTGIIIQLEKRIIANDKLRRRLQQMFDSQLAKKTTVHLTEYYKMKHQMNLDFSRKLNHIAP